MVLLCPFKQTHLKPCYNIVASPSHNTVGPEGLPGVVVPSLSQHVCAAHCQRRSLPSVRVPEERGQLSGLILRHGKSRSKQSAHSSGRCSEILPFYQAVCHLPPPAPSPRWPQGNRCEAKESLVLKHGQTEKYRGPSPSHTSFRLSSKAHSNRECSGFHGALSGAQLHSLLPPASPATSYPFMCSC